MVDGTSKTGGAIRPANFTRLFNKCWTGESLTNSDARKLVAELKAWAATAEHEDIKEVRVALDEVEILFFFAWNEIDQSLDKLNRIEMQGGSVTDDEHLAAAKNYLRRWQDKSWRNVFVLPASLR